MLGIHMEDGWDQAEVGVGRNGAEDWEPGRREDGKRDVGKGMLAGTTLSPSLGPPVLTRVLFRSAFSSAISSSLSRSCSRHKLSSFVRAANSCPGVGRIRWLTHLFPYFSLCENLKALTFLARPCLLQPVKTDP